MGVIQFVQLLCDWKSLSGAGDFRGSEMVICQGDKGISDIVNISKVSIMSKWTYNDDI